MSTGADLVICSMPCRRSTEGLIARQFSSSISAYAGNETRARDPIVDAAHFRGQRYGAGWTTPVDGGGPLKSAERQPVCGALLLRRRAFRAVLRLSHESGESSA